MKIFKSFMVMAMALTAGFFASCSEEGVWDAYDTTSTPTYSFEQKKSDYVLTPTDTMYQIPVRVFRNNTDGNDTIPVNVNIDNDLMTYETASVIFENGKDCAEFLLDFDFDRIEAGIKYTAKIEFVVDSLNYFEHNASITGNSKTEVSVQLKLIWEPVGKAIYREDFLTTFFKVSNIEYEVEVENVIGTGLIRIKNPYGEACPYNGPDEEGNLNYDPNTDHYMVLNCTDPEGVYIDGYCESSMNQGYGVFTFGSIAYYYMTKGKSLEEVKADGYCGTLDENLCITFPAKSLLVSMADYEGGGLYTANLNGAFKLDLSTTTLAE